MNVLNATLVGILNGSVCGIIIGVLLSSQDSAHAAATIIAALTAAYVKD